MKARLLFLGILFSTLASATHNRSGEIIYRRVAPFSNSNGPVYTYSVTVIRYTDDGSNIADRCVDTVAFGDGSKAVAPRINGPSGCCGTVAVGCGEIIYNKGGYTIKKNIYSVIHTYAGPGTYTLSSTDPNRNAGIQNIPNSVNVPFIIQSVLVISAGTEPNASPVLTNPPVDFGVMGACYRHNPCAFDENGDSLSYDMAPCPAAGFYYPPTAAGGVLVIGLNGLLEFCKPAQQGEYNLVLRVTQWKRTACGTYTYNGHVGRDLQMIISSGPSAWFTTPVISDTCVVAGAFSRTLSVASPSVIQAYIYGTASQSSPSAAISPSTGAANTIMTFSWQPACALAGRLSQDVHVVYEIPAATVNERIYRFFRLRVVAPAPLVTGVAADTSQVTLTWNSVSACGARVQGYRIYRRTGNSAWQHGPCETGVPASSGYSLIATVPSSVTSFTDQNLWTIPNGTTGNYIVTTFLDDCSESFAVTHSVSLIVGLEDQEFNQAAIGVFPNPSSGKITVMYPGQDPQQLLRTEVYTTQGRLVCGFVHAPGDELDVTGMAEGIYLLRIETSSGSALKKLCILQP